MFARILRDMGRGNIFEMVIQCDKVTMPYQNDNHVTVISNNGGECETYHLDKDVCELYLMNDEGRTIDSYRWAVAKPMIAKKES